LYCCLTVGIHSGLNKMLTRAHGLQGKPLMIEVTRNSPIPPSRPAIQWHDEPGVTRGRLLLLKIQRQPAGPLAHWLVRYPRWLARNEALPLSHTETQRSVLTLMITAARCKPRGEQCY
jgi:hypothetical protein